MDTTLRLLTYNIRKAVGLDGKRRPGRILDVINDSGAQIVVLQEADRRLGDRPAALPHRLIEEASDYHVLPFATNEVSLGWHGNAILVHRGLSWERTQRIDIPGLEPRGAVLADVATPDGANIRVVGVHLALLRRWRRQQLATIASHISSSGIGPTVVAGDFNEWSLTKGLEELSATHTIISPAKTFHASRPMAALDRFAVDNARVVDGAGVDETQRARISSDHLPIWLDLKLPDATAGPSLRLEAP